MAVFVGPCFAIFGSSTDRKPAHGVAEVLGIEESQKRCEA